MKLSPGKLSPGKLWGMRRLADAAGRWKMVALDQRTPLFGPDGDGGSEPFRRVMQEELQEASGMEVSGGMGNVLYDSEILYDMDLQAMQD